MMVKSIMYKTILFVALDLFYVHRVRQHAQPLPEDVAALSCRRVGRPPLDVSRTATPAHTKKRKVGGPSGVVGRPAHGPHSLQAPRGCPLLVSYVGSRRNMPVPRARRGWLPPIYMRGGAPFQDMEEMEDPHHQYKLH